jgi:hypothetical protein
VLRAGRPPIGRNPRFLLNLPPQVDWILSEATDL